MSAVRCERKLSNWGISLITSSWINIIMCLIKASIVMILFLMEQWLVKLDQALTSTATLIIEVRWRIRCSTRPRIHPVSSLITKTITITILQITLFPPSMQRYPSLIKLCQHSLTMCSPMLSNQLCSHQPSISSHWEFKIIHSMRMPHLSWWVTA